MRHIRKQGLDLIQRHEGFSPHVYLCPAGYPTIGYGHVVRNGEKFPNPITKEEAMELLQKDVAQAEAQVVQLISVPLESGQYDALVSFVYNLGGGALQRSTLRRKINRGSYLSAAEEFPRWVWAGGRKLPGLIARRKAEQLLFLKG